MLRTARCPCFRHSSWPLFPYPSRSRIPKHLIKKVAQTPCRTALHLRSFSQANVRFESRRALSLLSKMTAAGAVLYGGWHTVKTKVLNHPSYQNHFREPISLKELSLFPVDQRIENYIKEAAERRDADALRKWLDELQFESDRYRCTYIEYCIKKEVVLTDDTAFMHEIIPFLSKAFRFERAGFIKAMKKGDEEGVAILLDCGLVPESIVFYENLYPFQGITIYQHGIEHPYMYAISHSCNDSLRLFLEKLSLSQLEERFETDSGDIRSLMEYALDCGNIEAFFMIKTRMDLASTE